MSTSNLEVGHIFRTHKADFLDAFGDGLLPEARRVLDALAACRTAGLGGHVKKCDDCGHLQVWYNSCTNRHCPKCCAAGSAKWLDARTRDLLPIGYFHLVYTIPHELVPVALQNKRIFFTILFRSVSETLKTIGGDPKHLGAELGFLAILHTWGQNLMFHPHIHVVVPGGGLVRSSAPETNLDDDTEGWTWKSCPDNWFLSVKVLSQVFRGKFLDFLGAAYRQDKLVFHGSQEHLRDASSFRSLVNQLRNKDWVVYAKEPFAGPECVLKYLARYTHRVAIANSRLASLEDCEVTFRWKDYAVGSLEKLMTLDAVEFIRRFLLHVLPNGFQRIRYYGFMANRHRVAKVALCRDLLEVRAQPAPEPASPESNAADDPQTQVDSDRCPECKRGRLMTVAAIPNFSGVVLPAYRDLPLWLDTS